MAIEDVARREPEKIFKLPVNVKKGLDVEELIKVAENLGLHEYRS